MSTTQYFTFHRERLGKRGDYGSYLYKNKETGELIASHDSLYLEEKMTDMDYDDFYMLNQEKA